MGSGIDLLFLTEIDGESNYLLYVPKDKNIGNHIIMDIKRRLKRALNAVDDAQRALRVAITNTQDTNGIQRAIRELDDAETDIKRAIRELD